MKTYTVQKPFHTYPSTSFMNFTNVLNLNSDIFPMYDYVMLKTYKSNGEIFNWKLVPEGLETLKFKNHLIMSKFFDNIFEHHYVPCGLSATIEFYSMDVVDGVSTPKKVYVCSKKLYHRICYQNIVRTSSGIELKNLQIYNPLKENGEPTYPISNCVEFSRFILENTRCGNVAIKVHLPGVLYPFYIYINRHHQVSLIPNYNACGSLIGTYKLNIRDYNTFTISIIDDFVCRELGHFNATCDKDKMTPKQVEEMNEMMKEVNIIWKDSQILSTTLVSLASSSSSSSSR